MNLQARRVKGDVFTSNDTIEIKVSGVLTSLVYMTYAIEVVSGPSVSHGGGAAADEYLHYKAKERDADSNGVIDYTTSIMNVSQASEGDSVIRIKGLYLTQEKQSQYIVDMEAFDATMSTLTDLVEIEALRESEPTLTPDSISTGLLTLSWNTFDEFV
jgi:hypothetical protein